MRKRIAAFAALMILIAALGFGQVQKVRLWDTDLSHSLLFQWNENDNAARILNFYVAAATRSFHITGDTYVEQDYRVSASPTFLSLYLTSSTTSPFLKITNASDDEYDPIVQYAVGADPVTRWTHGLDDSLSNDFILSTGETLTTTAITETYILDVEYDDYLFVADTGNDRIKRHMRGDLSYSAKIGSAGSGDDQFSDPKGITSNGTYVYVSDDDNDRIKKHLISDLSYVSKIGSTGSGNDQFNNPRGIATDGTWLYIADSGNNRVPKRLCSDLSYVTEANGNSISGPTAVTTDGTYVYMVQNPGASYRIYKFLAADMSLVLRVMPAGVDGQLDNCSVQSACTTGGYLYMTNSNSIGTGGIKAVYKYNCSDLTYVTKFGDVGTGDGQFTAAFGITTDDTYLYVGDSNFAEFTNPHRIQKLQLDGTFIAKFGTYGNGDDQFYQVYGLSISGIIEIQVEVPAGGPIFRADHDATWFDVYPLLRARDGFRLMEDGTVGATKYVGHFAPSSITASYDLTWPAAASGAKKHLFSLATNQLGFGQNVDNDGTPTWPYIYLTVGPGTAPIQGVNSTTKVTNLNVDQLDSLDSTDFGPASTKYIVQEADGTLSAEQALEDLATGLLKVTTGTGVLSTAVAQTDYEAALGNPDIDGKVLSSTAAGVRSWIPPGGSLAVDDLSDVNAPAPNDGDALTWDDDASEWVAAPGGGGGGAPTDAEYIVGAADAGLSAERVKQALYINYDVDDTPGSPNALDDEFDDSSLNVKWTAVNNPGSPNSISETAYAGLIWVGVPENTGTDNFDAAVRLYQTPPAGTSAMTYIAKVAISVQALESSTDNGEFSTAGIYLGNSTDDEFLVASFQLNDASAEYVVGRGRMDANGVSGAWGAPTFDNFQAIPVSSEVYLKLEKTTALDYTSSNTYNVYYSLNGITWYHVGQQVKTFAHTVNEVGIIFRPPKSQGGSPIAYAIVDFFRRTI